MTTHADAIPARRAAPTELTDGACYLYAVVVEGTPIPSDLRGVGGAVVGIVKVGDLVAVASPATSRRVRPRRRELKAHQDVLNKLFAHTETGCLPFSFGTIVPDVEDLQELLEEARSGILAQLQSVAGCVELGITLSWDVEDVPAWFVARNPDLAARRDAAFANGTPGQETLIALGQRFDQLRNAAREAATAKVEAHVRSIARQVRRNPTRREDAVCDLSVLVPRAALNQLDGVLEAIAGDFDDDYVVGASGPFPPFSFVDLQLDN